MNYRSYLVLPPKLSSFRSAFVGVVFLTYLIKPLSAKCVFLFYDSAPRESPKYTFGRIHTVFLQNLLGHFPHIQVIIKPIEKYQTGDLNQCTSSIYLGTHYYSEVPRAFIDDYMTTDRNVLWAGYHVWQLPATFLKKTWDVEFKGLSKLESTPSNYPPQFFKYFRYKGEVFSKYLGQKEGRWLSTFEIPLFGSPQNNPRVLAYAIHSETSDAVPYVLRNANRWYMGDSPFSFITEEDRYLILCDLLFDVLAESPIRAEFKPALFRLEDVHARIPHWQLTHMLRLLKKHAIPFSISLIPVFSDPNQVLVSESQDKVIPMYQRPIFLAWIKEALQQGATAIFHGVTHQSGTFKNPWSGVSGDDFEFWNRVTNRPMPWDNPREIVSRIEDGYQIFEKAGVSFSAWLTPHYQASPLCYTLFGQLFDWNLGRIIYFPFIRKQKMSGLPSFLNLNHSSSKSAKERFKYLEGFEVEYDTTLNPNGQFFPYEIYGDIYGQNLLPENIGNVQPYLNEKVLKTIRLEDMLAHLKRNLVIRDSWGSFFVHPFLLNETTSEGAARFLGDTEMIESLIVETKKMGYEFIDLKTYVTRLKKEKAHDAIEFF